MKRLLIGMLAALLFAGCSPETGNVSTSTISPTATSVPTSAPARAEQQLAIMSDEEKVAQLFFVRPEALAGTGTVTSYSDALEEGLVLYPVGGVILFAHNIKNKAQVMDLNYNMQETAHIPLFIGVDEEGGQVSRIFANPEMGYTAIPPMGTLHTPDDARRTGEKLGRVLEELHFNVDFAPIADVNTNPDSPVIGNRSFGSDPQHVGDMVAAEIEGLHAFGVASAVKHFPGHGDTAQDSHETLPHVTHGLERLRSTEFVPFAAGIAAGTDFVMVGHIAAPNVTGTQEPATMSEKVVTELLKGELGFDGVVTTDALDMKAVSERYPAGEAAVRALQAGCDVLLMPDDFPAAYHAVLDAVRSGDVTHERLDDAVGRILACKEKLNILK